MKESQLTEGGTAPRPQHLTEVQRVYHEPPQVSCKYNETLIKRRIPDLTYLGDGVDALRLDGGSMPLL